MPKGRSEFPLPVPTRGLIGNLPPSKVQADAVIGGQNMIVDLTGRYVPRFGYSAFSTGSLAAGRVMGGLFFRRNDNTAKAVVATTTKWWDLGAASATDITGTANTGGADDPWRFVTFQQGTPLKTYLIGANNVNTVRRWNATDGGAYADLTNLQVCKDLCVLINRVVQVNIVDSGTRVVNRVKWTSVNDATTSPGGAIADLHDTADAIVACVPLGRTSAAIYRDRSIWTMLAQAGGDSTAFRFELTDRVAGPLSPASVIDFGGIHYYLAIDRRVYRFDGIRSLPISPPVEPMLKTDMGGLAYRARAHGQVLPETRHLVWWFPTADGTVNEALAFHLDTGRWEVKQVYGADTISASFFSEDFFGATNTPLVVVGTADGEAHKLLAGAADNGSAISYSWISPKMTQSTKERYHVDEIEPVFQESISTTPETVTVTVTGWEQPDAAEGQTLCEQDLHLNDGPRFRVRPQADLAYTGSARLLQVTMSGSTTTPSQVAYSGASLWANPEQD